MERVRPRSCPTSSARADGEGLSAFGSIIAVLARAMLQASIRERSRRLLG
jgi:hypothetical protein